MFAFFLPGLYERYGTRLQVSGIDLSQPAGEQAYRAVTEHLGLSPQPDPELTVVVGDRAIVGLFVIATALGNEFEQLALDPNAKRWPPVPALEALLPGGIADIEARVASEGIPPAESGSVQSSSDEFPFGDRIAHGLAIVVLLAMVLALIHFLVRLRRPDGMTGRVAFLALLLA